MHILLVSATWFEVAPLCSELGLTPPTHVPNMAPNRAAQGQWVAESLVTGIGAASTALALGHRLAQLPRPDLMVNLGIAGSYDHTVRLTTVLEITSDTYGDLGAETPDGGFIDLAQLGFPITNTGGQTIYNRLDNPLPPTGLVPVAQGITVNSVSGSAATIAHRLAYWGPNSTSPLLESMEGAAVLHAALLHNLPCRCFRAVSNYVEPRNTTNWQIRPALDSLNTWAAAYLRNLCGV